MTRMFKLLVRDPIDELESIVEVRQSGSYFDPTRVLHDERVDGPLGVAKIQQVINRGNMKVSADQEL